MPEIVPFTTVRRGRLIPSKCWCGTGPFPDTKRREMPNKPERRGMSIPEDPNEPAPRNANWKENSPSIPDMRKIIPLCRGDSEKRTRYPTTPVRMIATAQSRYPWTNGASRSRASATGREPGTLPRFPRQQYGLLPHPCPRGTSRGLELPRVRCQHQEFQGMCWG